METGDSSGRDESERELENEFEFFIQDAEIGDNDMKLPGEGFVVHG